MRLAVRATPLTRLLLRCFSLSSWYGSDKGRAAYSTYMRLLAEPVAEYPAATMVELMNEPPRIDEPFLYRLDKACYGAVPVIEY